MERDFAACSPFFGEMRLLADDYRDDAAGFRHIFYACKILMR